MNLEIPRDLPGRSLTEIYQDSDKSPLWSSDRSIEPLTGDGALPEEAEILARLKVLGYIE
jgi:hypothetical protein